MRIMAGRRIYVCAVSLLLGTVSVQAMAELPPNWFLVSLLLCALPGFLFRTVLPVSCFLLGFCWAVFRAELLLVQTLPSELEREDVRLEAVVDSLVQQEGPHLKFTVSVNSLTRSSRSYPAPEKVLLRWYDATDKVRIGQGWHFTARLKRPHGFQNPGGFDFEKWLFRRGIRATGYIVKAQRWPALDRDLWWDRYREIVQQYLMESDFGNQGLIRALVVGDRGGVGTDQRNVLVRTGTLHLLAISGLHIGLVAGFCFIIGSSLARALGRGLLWIPAPMSGAGLAILGGGVYALLAGLTIPTQRAVIMIVAVMMALLLKRSISVVRSLTLALILVLMADPLTVLDTGFWLSFGALSAILLALKATAGSNSRIPRVVRVQLLLNLLLAPIVLGFFGQLSVSAPIANLIAIPVVAFAVVPLVLCASVLLGAGWQPGANILYRLSDVVLDWLWPVLAALSQPPWAVWVRSPQWWVLAAAGLGLVMLVVIKSPGHKVLGLLFLAPLLLPASALDRPVIGQGGFTLNVLDVGQGLSMVVRTRNHTLLYDTGARFSSRFDAGAAVVTPYLRYLGIDKLDMLVISHGDADHIGGMPVVLDQIKVVARLTSVPGKVPLSGSCVAGQQWKWDGVAFSVLSPDVADPPAHNNSSCVIRISGRTGSALLTGDIEVEAESVLLQRFGDQIKSDVLLIPHHGSRTSSSTQFIESVAPDIAVTSAGYLNRYGHPADSVAQRYQDRNIPLFNTARDGAVSVRMTGGGIDVNSYRTSHRRYWFGGEDR